MLRGEPGAIFVLRAEDLGSLDVGSPVFYRRTRVGRVVGYTLDPERDELSVQVFVEAPYEKLVTTNTRFWNASGIDLTLNASGLTLNTQSLASVLAGGIAFESPAGAAREPPAPEKPSSRCSLTDARRWRRPDGTPVPMRMVVRPDGARAGAGRADRPARRRDRQRAQRRAALRRQSASAFRSM